MHYLYVRPIRIFWHLYLQSVRTGVEKCTRTYGQSVQAVRTGALSTPVHTGRKDGPYVRAVHTGSAYRP